MGDPLFPLEVGSEEHRSVFGSDSHVKSSFAILHGEDTKVELLGRLKEHGLLCKNEFIMMVEFINSQDASGNSVSIGASHGSIV